MADLERVANWYGTRAHYAAAMSTRGVDREGRRGVALCSTDGSPVDVFDQEAIDMSMPFGWRKRKVIDELPLCKRCERKAALGIQEGGNDVDR